MNCHATRAVLDLHAEKRLTPRREKAVAAHLSSCAECRAQIATEPYGEEKSLLSSHAVKKGPTDFKARLAATLKNERKATEPRPEPKLELWPRDLSGVAFASVALALVALFIGWSGVPSQRDISGDDLELAAGRTP